MIHTRPGGAKAIPISGSSVYKAGSMKKLSNQHPIQPQKKPSIFNKHTLYEVAVQSPEVHIHWFNHFFRELLGRQPHNLREDFCGTFLLSADWVKSDPGNTAVGLDIDPLTLEYGIRNHLKKMNSKDRKRLLPLCKNVLSVTKLKTDLIVACNFSFCIFKKRKLLIQYFTNCYRSLGRDGLLVLELAGGPGMIQTIRESRMITMEDARKTRVKYTWHQKSFDPVSHEAHYAIHFKLPDGTQLKDAFTYDWRLWTIPEVRECLAEAGFQDSAVYWETEHKGKGTGEFVRTEHGDNAHAWIGYIVGIKTAD